MLTGSQLIFLLCLIALILTLAMMVAEIFRAGRSASGDDDEGGELRPLPPSLLPPSLKPRVPGGLPDCLLPKPAASARVRQLEKV